MGNRSRKIVTMPNGMRIGRREAKRGSNNRYFYEYDMPGDYYERVVAPFISSCRNSIGFLADQKAEEFETEHREQLRRTDPVGYVAYMREQDRDHTANALGYVYACWIGGALIGKIVGVLLGAWIIGKFIGCL